MLPGSMLWLAAAVQKVEIVGGESWLEHNSVAIAAITAAVLAATVAVLNQRRQLVHDRSLRNQDHIRDAIDQATMAGGSTRQAANSLLATTTSLEKKREEDPEASFTALKKERRKAMDELLANLQRMHTQLTRLEIRLSQDHSVAAAYREAWECAIDIVHKAKVVTPDMDAEKKEERKRSSRALTEAYDGYRDACFAWFNE